MGRYMRQENISEQYKKLNKYHEKITKFIQDNQPNIIVEHLKNSGLALQETSIDSISDAIKSKLKDKNSFFLFINTLFNKNGIKKKRQHIEELIDLLVESALFELYGGYHKTLYKEQESFIMSLQYNLPDLGADESMYDMKLKQVVYTIKQVYNISYEEALCMVLENLLLYLKKVNGTTSSLQKLNTVYSLLDYMNILSSLVYSRIVTIAPNRELTSLIEEFRNINSEQQDLSTVLDRVRRNIDNRSRSLQGIAIAKEVCDTLSTIGKVEQLQKMPIFVLIDILCETDETDSFDWMKGLNKVQREYTIGEFYADYEILKSYLPDNGLEIEKAIREEISTLNLHIKRFVPAHSDLNDIYEQCFCIYHHIKCLFEWLSKIGHPQKFTHSFQIFNKMRDEVIEMLLSTVVWNGSKTEIYNIIFEGAGEFMQHSNYSHIKLFDNLNASLFIPYMKSLVLEYLFIDATDVVVLIIDTINMVSDYIKKIVIKLYNPDDIISSDTVNSLVCIDLKKHFSSSMNICEKLFMHWETRKNHGLITFEQMCELIRAKKILMEKL